LKIQSIEVDPEVVGQGLRGALSNQKPLLMEEEFRYPLHLG
jgi:hypothetical protein